VLRRLRPVGRDELVEALWPRRSPVDAQAALNTLVARLRAALGAGVIAGRSELSLVLGDDPWIDVEAAQAAVGAGRVALETGRPSDARSCAEEALAIVEQPLLRDLDRPWLDDHRRLLEALRPDLLAIVGHAGLALGGAALARGTEAARELAAREPFSESVRSLLMRLLAAAGDIAEAVRVYDDLRTHLRDELGTVPSPPLVALHERLLTAPEKVVPAASSPGAGLPGQRQVLEQSVVRTAGGRPPAVELRRALPRAPRPAVGQVPFTGREQQLASAALTTGRSARQGGEAMLLLEREGELGELDAAMCRARDGNGRVVLIEGPAGIGKTRLLDETRGHARAGGLGVLAARGGELERGYPFGVVRQLLEPSVARACSEDRSELLSGAAMHAEVVFSAAASTSHAAADTPQTVLHGLYWLVANLAERSPLLLVIDDVHWADGPSLRFLLYLARRLNGMPVALALALRTGEISAQPQLLRALRLETEPPVLQPSALSPQATKTLTVAGLRRGVPEALAQACHKATRGNPFLLMELLHQLRGAPGDTDPAAVGRMASERMTAEILLRIDRAGASASALVRATSVLGNSADIETAAALAAIDRATATELTEALAHAEIFEPIQSPSGSLRFVHPLVRTAVYDDIPRSERARLHARAAQLLTRGRGGADAAAMHLLLTAPAGDGETVELLRKAASGAIARGAPETALEFLRRAEREPPPEAARPALLLELGTAALRAGDPDGVDLLREAFEQAKGQPERALAGLELSFALGVSRSQSADVIPILERARDRLQDEDLLTLLDARLIIFANCVPAARTRVPARLRDPRLAIQRPPSEARLVLLSVLAGHLALYTDHPAADIAGIAERALSGGQLVRRDIATESDFALAAVWALICIGRLRAAKHHLDDGITAARARGSAFALARFSGFRALAHVRLGELRTAESDADSALAIEAAWGMPHAISTAVLAAIHIERGDLDGARAALGSLDPDPAMLEVSPSQIVRETRAALSSAEGEPHEALRELQAYARWEEQSGIGHGLVPVMWRSAAALAHLQLGEHDKARELAAREVELARRFGAPPRLGTALRVLGVVESGTRGLALLEEAVSVLEGSAARLDHARALVDLGALLRRSGRRRDATDRLRAGRDLAHRCGATALVEAAAAQLRLAGARPRRIAVTGRDSLTPGERRVTDLAVEGMANKEIAQALFVTLRTVEMHLSNSYRKLDIAGRQQLPVALSAD
jgi:DNA-binding SARP family transcriptional activator/DNA-binding CsgD family transcriptional regulator